MVQKIVTAADTHGYDVVLNALEKLGIASRDGETGEVSATAESDHTGEHLYRALQTELDSPQAASEYLNSIGVSGLRYLDRSSRAKGDSTRNYVIWDESCLNKDI